MSVLVAGSMLSGCAGLWREPEPPKEVIKYQETATDAILACVAENKKYSRKEFNSAYKATLADANRPDNNAAPSALVCLSLHQRATYKQFKGGVEVLGRYTKAHPESTPSLRGLVQLLQRLDQEKIGKWAQSSKNLDVKEELETENRDLLERIDTLEKSSTEDQARIKGLQQQIEQLKNIENIIKNRER
ncbi:hypothetical protein [Desulfobulbus sp.]|uniref:hypothetical protein n=1 Tax=Desulfobulbus sp. TaxID=895 RepID=UPI00286EF898|nr:hypothetical protein [Desulfobulbus sp.]